MGAPRGGGRGGRIRHAPTGGRARAGDVWEKRWPRPRERGGVWEKQRGRGTCRKTTGTRLAGGGKGNSIRNAPTGGRARAGTCGKNGGRAARAGACGKNSAGGGRVGNDGRAARRGKRNSIRHAPTGGRARAGDVWEKRWPRPRGRGRVGKTARAGGVWENVLCTAYGRGTCGKTPGARLTGGGRGAVRRCRGRARSRGAGPRRAAPRRA